MTIDTSVVRVVHNSISELLVVGRDADGQWMAIVGTQGGLPGDCYVLNERGFNLGASIAIEGVRWAKSPAFIPNEPEPPLGQAYPGATRFCLDEQGRVSSIIPASWRI